MGVTGDLLSRILKTAGRELDLQKFRRGVEGPTDEEHGEGGRIAKKRKLRPLRIGLDISGWLATAIHGHGSMLIDERHLSNFGRAQLMEQSGTNGNGNGDKSNTNTAKTNQKYVETCSAYVLEKILKLKSSTKADLLVVFDGKTPPPKEEECRKRSEKRKEAAEKRDALGDNEGNDSARIKAAKRAGAGGLYPNIVSHLIVELRHREMPFMVAPYEADGQLAHLAQNDLIDLVLTEDCDLICFGMPSIAYKNGSVLVQRYDLGAMEMLPKSLSLPDFSDSMLAAMFAAIGCDYCSSLPGIGSVTARDAVVAAFNPTDPSQQPPLERFFQILYEKTKEKNLTDEDKRNYEEGFMAALFLYRHPMIFCPLKGKCVLMGDPFHGGDPELRAYQPYHDMCLNTVRQEEITGRFPPEELQLLITEGWIDPRTMKPRPSMQLPPNILNLWDEYNKTLSPDGSQNKSSQPVAPPKTQEHSVDSQPETQEVVQKENGSGDPQSQPSPNAGRPKSPEIIEIDDDSDTTQPMALPATTRRGSFEADVISSSNNNAIDKPAENVMIAALSPFGKQGTQGSSGTSSASKIASQPSQASDGSHITADIQSPQLLSPPRSPSG